MSTPQNEADLDVVVVGGCGHVGLPLAVALASRGSRVGIYDIDDAAVAGVSRGVLQFREDGLQQLLDEALEQELLTATTDPATIARGESSSSSSAPRWTSTSTPIPSRWRGRSTA